MCVLYMCVLPGGAWAGVALELPERALGTSKGRVSWAFVVAFATWADVTVLRSGCRQPVNVWRYTWVLFDAAKR